MGYIFFRFYKHFERRRKISSQKKKVLSRVKESLIQTTDKHAALNIRCSASNVESCSEFFSPKISFASLDSQANYGAVSYLSVGEKILEMGFVSC